MPFRRDNRGVKEGDYNCRLEAVSIHCVRVAQKLKIFFPYDLID